MNILIRIPNWLGDAVMATYALELLFVNFKNAHFYLVGSATSIALFAHYPRVSIIEDQSKKSRLRIWNLYSLAKSIPPCEIAITFQNTFLSALFLFFNGARWRVGFKTEMRSFFLHYAPQKPKHIHEALRFFSLAESVVQRCCKEIVSIPQKLYLKPKSLQINLKDSFKHSKIAGINAGAAFGAAKRWESSYFAEVILFLLQKNYKIILFGVVSENQINEEIARLVNTSSENLLNLSGKTSIQELISYFLKLDFLLTNDSGPMHIANALGVRTLALFGPTNALETAPFCATNARIISLETLGIPVPCAPCLMRSCPLRKDSKEYHQCMRKLEPRFVIQALLDWLDM